MKKILLVLIICFAIFCCKHDNYKNFSNAIYEIEVKESDFYKYKKLSDIMDTIKYIPLETSKNCLIGKIAKIIHRKGLFYIFDNIANSVFLYNEEGKFISKYCKIGKGPFEYYELNDIDVDSEGNCYLIETRRIIMLDKNLKPIKEIKLPFGTMRFAVNKNEIATVHLGNEDEIQILSFEGKKIRTYFPYSGIQRLVELKAFAKFESELLYKPIRCDDSIFSISSDSISLHTKILFEKPAPKEFLVKPLNFKQMDPPGCMAGVYYYCESKEFISFLFMYNYKGDDGPFHTLFSKKNGSTIIYTDKIENDCYLSKYTPAFKEVTEDGRFITSINATFFHEAIKKNPHLLKKYNITEMSNPIIALIKLKDL